MKKFHYPLERLLKLRRHTEQEWEIKLGEATGRCVRIKRAIAQREANHRRVLGERGSLSPDNLMAGELYLSRMRQEAAALRQELEEAEAERLKVQASFLEASRERKVLQKLKEKQEKAYLKEELKREFAEADDRNSGASARDRTDKIKEYDQIPGVVPGLTGGGNHGAL